MSSDYRSSFLDDLDRFAQIALLYDSYKQLLTDKQCDVIEMYFANDLSLSEIGQELGISRQAVGILINRTEKILRKYEQKLGLVHKSYVHKNKMEEIALQLKELTAENDISAPIRRKLIELAENILEDLEDGL